MLSVNAPKTIQRNYMNGNVLVSHQFQEQKKSIPIEIQNVFTDLFIVRKHLSYFYTSQSGFIGKIRNDSVT